MSHIIAPTDGSISKREIEHVKMVREIAADGMVLLENDGTLPLSLNNKNIALYGSGARRTIKGGSGSGDVNSRHVVSVEEGFENAGYRVLTKKWLDEYDKTMDQAMSDYLDNVLKMSAEQNLSPFVIMALYLFVAPSMRSILPEELTDETDTAVYVIARKSGEGADRLCKEEEYLLGNNEIEDLCILAEHYEKVVVVLNVGGVIDTKPLREISGISAVLLMSQAGCAGGDALVDVLTGKVTPSGKLTSTWAVNYEDYVTSEHFSKNDGNLDESYYEEGIYVGYRYFDTFNVNPAYCFGYGMSYTQFVLETTELITDHENVQVSVKVKNIGETYSGREVVQIYVSSPDGKLEKPYQELKAYEKTKLLAPGEEQILKIIFPVNSLASYSEEDAAWILEGGDYLVRVGNSSRNTKIVAKLELGTEVKTQILKNLFGESGLEKELHRDKESIPYSYTGEAEEKETALKVSLDVKKIPVEIVNYTKCFAELPKTEKSEKITVDDIFAGNATVEELVSQLTPEELATLCVGAHRFGGSGSVFGSSSYLVPGAAGDTTSMMIEDRNIRNVISADGPAGVRITPVFHSKDGEMISEFHIATRDMEMMMEKLPEGMIPKTDLTGTTEHYQYCTAIPIDTLLAQTWDYQKIRQAGHIVGKEMEEFGVSLWLAPGMNIHRDPLCGRNYEYYSEDPLITGMCAAAETEGIQSNRGVGTTVKHFACNNQEENRFFNNSHVSERTLREIYLKGFEICVRKSQPMAMMSSYNLINGVHAANNYDLLTAAARDEWGFEGIIVTDWGTTKESMVAMLSGESLPAQKYGYSKASGCVKAGNDLTMPGSQEDVEDILNALGKKEGETEYPLTLGELQKCACRMLNIIIQSSSYENAGAYNKTVK